MFDCEAALAATMQLFWRNGFSATSMYDLTSAMKIGSPSLYDAFGSKEALYQYVRTNEPIASGCFLAAKTARDAVVAFLHDKAAGVVHAANGSTVTLSAVGAEGHANLGTKVAGARQATLTWLVDLLKRGQAAGEIGATVDVHALARFVQTLQNGMSLIARRSSLKELRSVADTAILGWDARASGPPSGLNRLAISAHRAAAWLRSPHAAAGVRASSPINRENWPKRLMPAPALSSATLGAGRRLQFAILPAPDDS